MFPALCPTPCSPPPQPRSLHICVLIHVCAGTDTCLYACQRTSLATINPLLFLRESLTLWNLPCRLGWLASKLMHGSSCLCLPSARIIDTCHRALLFPHGFGGLRLWSPGFATQTEHLASFPCLPLLFYIHPRWLTWKTSATASRQMLGSVLRLPVTQ